MPEHRKRTIVVVDTRNGKIYRDGSNINVAVEGQEALLRAVKEADVLVEVTADNILVNRGAVSVVTTKSEAQMSAEKADAQLAARQSANQRNDLEAGEHPVTAKFPRVWDHSIESGKPVEGGLKGY